MHLIRFSPGLWQLYIRLTLSTSVREGRRDFRTSLGSMPCEENSMHSVEKNERQEHNLYQWHDGGGGVPPGVGVEGVEHDGVEVEGDPVRRRVRVDAEVLQLA